MAASKVILPSNVPIVEKDGNPSTFFVRQLTQLLSEKQDIATAADAAAAAAAAAQTTADAAVPTSSLLAQFLTAMGGDPNVDRMLFWDDSAGNFKFLTPGTGLSISGTTLAASGGGGSTAWTLVDTNGAATASPTWTWSTNVANIDVKNLGSFNEMLVFCRNVPASISGQRGFQVSVDNGVTFYHTTSDYVGIDVNGVEATNTLFAGHSLAVTAARSLFAEVKSMKGLIKAARSNNGTDRILFVGSTSDINAIRFANFVSGAVTGVMTAGSLYVYVR